MSKLLFTFLLFEDSGKNKYEDLYDTSANKTSDETKSLTYNHGVFLQDISNFLLTSIKEKLFAIRNSLRDGKD